MRFWPFWPLWPWPLTFYSKRKLSYKHCLSVIIYCDCKIIVQRQSAQIGVTDNGQRQRRRTSYPICKDAPAILAWRLKRQWYELYDVYVCPGISNLYFDHRISMYCTVRWVRSVELFCDISIIMPIHLITFLRWIPLNARQYNVRYDFRNISERKGLGTHIVVRWTTNSILLYQGMKRIE